MRKYMRKTRNMRKTGRKMGRYNRRTRKGGMLHAPIGFRQQSKEEQNAATENKIKTRSMIFEELQSKPVIDPKQIGTPAESRRIDAKIEKIKEMKMTTTNSNVQEKIDKYIEYLEYLKL